MTRLKQLLLLAGGAAGPVLAAAIVVAPRIAEEPGGDSNASGTPSPTATASPTPIVPDLEGKLLEVATGAVTPLWGQDERGGMLEFSADGRMLAFAKNLATTAEQQAWQVFTMDLSPGPSPPTPVGSGSVPKPSSDGAYLVFGANPARVFGSS